MDEISKILGGMEPRAALTAMAAALKRLFADLDDEARAGFLMDLLGEAEGDKVSSLVHL
jgi:hypothetical protein